jgi:hypothetical protein
MSAPDDKNSRQSDAYITWLETCDKAIALGRSLLEPPSTDEVPAAENETLKILLRLDRLRAAASFDRPAVFFGIGFSMGCTGEGWPGALPAGISPCPVRVVRSRSGMLSQANAF